MLCNIRGFHGDDYEECHLLGCDAMLVFLPSMLLLLVSANAVLARRFLSL
jgi:hypothetical protein